MSFKRFFVFIFALVFVTTKVAIGGDNFTPTVESVFLHKSPFINADAYENGIINDLVASGTLNLYLNGLVQDMDGSSDIVSVSGVFYRSGAPIGADCLADNNFCYRIATCNTQTTENPFQLRYSCPLSVWYYADATVGGGRYENEDWRAFIQVNDQVSSSFNNFFSREVSTLLALTIPDRIDFGPRSLGSITTSENNVAMPISQGGNVLADVEVSGSEPLICSENGSIPAQNQGWALMDVGFGDSVALTSSAVDTNLNVFYQEDDLQASFKELYWNISIPSSGLRGVCSGSTVITAIAH
ncbi:MAG TPA: hypothetical protein VJB99_02330 [Patescibacteria group bacterium]|nr:hypothetical protein [Patescibacteria group bacterium]